MNNFYEYFKLETITATKTISHSNKMRAVSDDFERGFELAMWEAREIFMRLQDKYKIEEIE